MPEATKAATKGMVVTNLIPRTKTIKAKKRQQVGPRLPSAPYVSGFSPVSQPVAPSSQELEALAKSDPSHPLYQRVCGSPAVDGYAHVRPDCLESSPTNRWAA